MIHELLLQLGEGIAYVLLFMAVRWTFSCFYMRRFCKKTRVDESADLSGDMPDHVVEKMKEEFNELMPMESCSLDKTLEEIVFEPSALEAEEESPYHTTKIIPLVPRLQQKKARQNRKANTTMNTHLTILLATLFFASCGRASNQDTFDLTGRPTQGTLTPDDILEEHP